MQGEDPRLVLCDHTTRAELCPDGRDAAPEDIAKFDDFLGSELVR